MTTVRGITSRVDIMWSWDGSVISTMNGVNVSMIRGSIAEYSATYTIAELSTTDDDRVYQCEVVINTSPPVSTSTNISLDTTGGFKIYNYNLCYHYFVSVPIPDVSVIPFGSIVDGIVGSPQEIHCTVSTVSGVKSHLVLISWMGPVGVTITNDSRVTISPTISINNDYISTLEFAYLMEGDEGIYTCDVMILETTASDVIAISNLTGKVTFL